MKPESAMTPQVTEHLLVDGYNLIKTHTPSQPVRAHQPAVSENRTAEKALAARQRAFMHPLER